MGEIPASDEGGDPPCWAHLFDEAGDPDQPDTVATAPAGATRDGVQAEEDAPQFGG